MQDSWEIRFEWIQTILQWVSLVVGVGLSVLQFGVNPATIAASAAVTGYTIAMQAIPARSKRIPLVAALLSLLGVVTSLFAISLTGGIDSAFLLYLAVPVFYASAFHGTILGGLTALAAIAGLVAVTTASTVNPLSSNLPLMVVFYALIGLTFSQAHRILIEQPREAAGGASFDRLEAAHRLLGDLADLASTAELNPVTIGRNALRDLAVTVPFVSGQIAIIDNGEEITVGTRGQPGPANEATTFGIDLNRRRLGSLRLWAIERGFEEVHESEIEYEMRSVALAFDNVLLLQSIAHRAVREERVRVARELHDDIGPSLVSVGLGLDVVIHHSHLDHDARQQLGELRQTVGELVDEIRITVAHLRSTDTTSLVAQAHALAEDAPADGPSFVVEMYELEAPVGREAEYLSAILTEAVRNALDHAGAGVIEIRGTIGRDHGEMSVLDDGCGIDPDLPATGRYGLIGMQERADEIGARLSIDSEPRRGTSVTITWGES